MTLFNRMARMLIGAARAHPYSHLWHADGTPYMERYWLMPRCLLVWDRAGHWDKRFAWLPSARIHHTLSSDYDRALHDHPFSSCSLILFGHYIEVTPRHQAQGPDQDALDGGVRSFVRKPGDFVTRRATDRHRLVIPPGTSCWSLFIMGRRERQWGFHTEAGWVSRNDYASTNRKVA